MRQSCMINDEVQRTLHRRFAWRIHESSWRMQMLIVRCDVLHKLSLCLRSKVILVLHLISCCCVVSFAWRGSLSFGPEISSLSQQPSEYLSDMPNQLLHVMHNCLYEVVCKCESLLLFVVHWYDVRWILDSWTRRIYLGRISVALRHIPTTTDDTILQHFAQTIVVIWVICKLANDVYRFDAIDLVGFIAAQTEALQYHVCLWSSSFMELSHSRFWNQ